MFLVVYAIRIDSVKVNQKLVSLMGLFRDIDPETDETPPFSTVDLGIRDARCRPILHSVVLGVLTSAVTWCQYVDPSVSQCRYSLHP